MDKKLNKNVEVWRGTKAPPTTYHVWVKPDGSIHVHDGTNWKSTDEYITKEEFTTIENNFLNYINTEITKITNQIPEINYYSLNTVSEEELKSLGSNIKDAYKLVNNKGILCGDYIKLYKDSSLKKVEFDNQILRFTYILAEGNEQIVDIDVSAFLHESEYGVGLQVVDHIVSIKKDNDSESFLSISDKGIKLTGVQDAIAITESAAKKYADGLNVAMETRIKDLEDTFSLSKYEWVDLGLPSGLKWASTNVGATKPEEFGLYFAWGETQGYEDITDEKQFRLSDYKWCNGSSTTLTKYNNSSSYGIIDDLIILEQIDDAAYQSNSTCRMPTKADFDELIANTTSVWERLNDVNGRRFTSKTNGNSIFLPAAGVCINGSFYNIGSVGSLWSSSLYSSDPNNAYSLSLGSSSVGMSINSRYDGFSVRAVQESNVSSKFNPAETVSKVNNLEAQLGDINAALDYIINGPKLITFTIDSVEYQAGEGMTWEEWVNSEYNTDGFIISGINRVLYKGDNSNDTNAVCDPDLNSAFNTDCHNIKNNCAYYFYTGSGMFGIEGCG